LNDHPGHVRSDEAKRPFPEIFALAVAGRTAAEPLRTRSQATAASALLSWARVYRPTGNPIDEWFFVPLFQAADLVAWLLPAGEAATLVAWTRAFGISGDPFLRRPAQEEPVAGEQLDGAPPADPVRGSHRGR
jgi:hypothetical protein